MAKRVNIIGAGPGGLASAMLLAKAGADVHIFERQPHVGGRTSTLEQDGFRFDLGPTFFMYPRILEELFRSVGRDLNAEVELKRLDPQYKLVFEGGGQIEATPDVARMEKEIARISPEDAGNFRAFLAANRQKLEAFSPILQRPFNGWRDLSDPSLLRSLPHLRPWASVDSDLRRFFKDPRVRLAFSFQSKYLGMSPFRCPSLFTILSFLEYEHGVYHPIGGCAELSRAMARVATDLGVKIHLNEEVRGLNFSGKRVTGLRTDSGDHPADSMVINADFAHAMRKLVPDALRRRWTNKKLAKKKFSCSTFMMYLGLRRKVDHLAHHTIFMSEDYERNLDEIENRHVLSDRPSFYVQNPGVTDPSLAPEGKSGLYVLVPVTHQHPNVDWAREREGYRRKVLDRLGAVGLEDIEKDIETERVITPADWEGQQHIHRGATFNLAHNFGQMLHLRPRNRFEDLHGVYLVGGGTHPGSGLPVIFESARISSRLLLEDMGLSAEWIERSMRGGAEAPVENGMAAVEALTVP
jgi:phytoene desaturase